jgi:excisionase family DNA binding protein
MRLPHSASAAEHAFARAATDRDVFGWLRHVRSAAGCTRPIRLAGKVAVVDTTTGQVMSAVDTADMPDGVIYKPCGNRRATVCPSCAAIYQRDAYHLIRAGLVGGKGVPSTVAQHHAVFPTLTAPSFGVVHSRRTGNHGQQLPCRPRRRPDVCPHGVDLRCNRVHHADEKALGQPLCLDCYDYAGQAVWNHKAPELWRRTTIAITRAIRRRARTLGIPAKAIRLSFGKVAEMQRRGVVHYHAIIRLDGVDPADLNAIIPPPPGLTAQDLVDAVEHAAPATSFTTEPHPVQPGGWIIAWGDQLHCPPVRVSGDGDITDGVVASYLAKYATKSTEATGHSCPRLTDETIDLHADPDGSHVERLVDACWTLGRPRRWRGLRRWAHMLGFGGHFLTKSADTRSPSASFASGASSGATQKPTTSAPNTPAKPRPSSGSSTSSAPAGTPPATRSSPTPARPWPGLDIKPPVRPSQTRSATAPTHSPYPPPPDPSGVNPPLTRKARTVDTRTLLDQLADRGAVVALIPQPRDHDPGPTTVIQPRWLTVRQAAQTLNYSLSKTKMLVATGQLRSIKDGGSRRILPEWVDEYVARKTAQAIAEVGA